MSEFLNKADEVLFLYTQPNEDIDCGNLFFAATEYRKAYEKLQAENAELKKIIQSVRETVSEHKSCNSYGCCGSCDTLESIEKLTSEE